MKRAKTGEQGSKDGPVHIAAIDSSLATKYPSLAAHCAVLRYDDGTPRKAGWYTVGTMGAAWTVTVKDPDGGCQLRCTGTTLDDAYAMADLLLGSDECPWEPDLWAQQRGKSNKKSA